MEPFDFDKIIREKILEEGNVHSRESNIARSAIWIDIQDKLKKGRFISWYHLVASILLLIVGFTIILFRIQNRYNNENKALMTKIESLEKKYAERTSSIGEKNEQIRILTSNLDNLEKRIAGFSEKQAEVPIFKTIYKTDTVFVRSVEYVTIPESEKLPEDKKDVDPLINPDYQEKNVIASTIQSQDIIYPSPKTKIQADEPEKVKIRFGNYIAREN